MPYLRFIATPTMRTLNDVPKFEDGDVKEVTAERAKYLLESFPGNFAPAKTRQAPPVNKAQGEPPVTKDEAPETESEQAPAVLTETEQAQLKAIEKKLKKDPEGKKLSEYERDLLEKAKAAKG